MKKRKFPGGDRQLKRYCFGRCSSSEGTSQGPRGECKRWKRCYWRTCGYHNLIGRSHLRQGVLSKQQTEIPLQTLFDPSISLYVLDFCVLFRKLDEIWEVRGFLRYFIEIYNADAFFKSTEVGSRFLLTNDYFPFCLLSLSFFQLWRKKNITVCHNFRVLFLLFFYPFYQMIIIRWFK